MVFLASCEVVSWQVVRPSLAVRGPVSLVPVCKALRMVDLEQNAVTIYKSNPEHLLVLRLHAGTIHECNPEHLLVLRLHVGTIHEPNPEHLPVFKAPRGDDPRV